MQSTVTNMALQMHTEFHLCTEHRVNTRLHQWLQSIAAQTYSGDGSVSTSSADMTARRPGLLCRPTR